jgi:hypothetical protein
MTKDSEIRKHKVLGEDWVIEIDYNDSGEMVCIDIYGEEGTRVRSLNGFELQVIGKNLMDIGKKLSCKGLDQ